VALQKLYKGWIFLLVISLQQIGISQTPYTSHLKDRIEWVFTDESHHSLSKSTYLKEVYRISEGVLSELEGNLIYKVSDKIHLIGFVSWSRFVNYKSKFTQQSHFNKSKEPVYYPVYLGSDLNDALPQIKRGLAQQYLREFLLGFSYSEKLNPLSSYQIPDWLLLGFIGYFSDGITRDEFLKFQQLTESSDFNNVNYIPKTHKELFGKVMWYWFEKDKTKDVNSVFWQILRRAHNFEKTFGYHFEKRFGDWLNEKIVKAQQLKSDEVIYSDVQFVWNSQNFRNVKILWNKEATDYRLISNQGLVKPNEEVKINSNLIQIANQTFKNQLYPQFAPTDFKIYLSLNESNWILYNHGEPINLGDKGKYQIINTDLNGIYILNTEQGIQTVHRLNSATNEMITVKSWTNFWGSTSLFIDKDSSYFDNREVRLNKDKYVSLFLRSNCDDWDTLFSKAHTDAFVSLHNFIVESPTHFSCSYNDGWKKGILHIKDGKQMLIPSKGYMYRQDYLAGTDSLYESFLANGKIHTNFMQRGLPVLTQDTIPLTDVTDEISPKHIQFPKKKSMYPSGDKFVSPYQYEPTKTYNRRFTEKRKQPWVVKPFKPWFYGVNGKFYFSNNEIDIPYHASLKPTERYNSPFTLFYALDIPEVFEDQQLNLRMFTNLNRRRIGIGFDYEFKKQPLTHRFSFDYRLRQFEPIPDIRKRDRSLLLQYGIEKKLMGWVASSSTQLFYNGIISINSNPELLPLNTQRTYAPYLKMKITKALSKHDAIIERHLTQEYGMSVGQIRNSLQKSFASALFANVHSKARYKGFQYFGNLKFRYSLSESNIGTIMGGSQGWISRQAFTNEQWNKIDMSLSPLIANALPVRGVQAGERIGNSFVYSQQNVALSPLSIFNGTVLESKFWQSIEIIGFFDFGTAFYGNTTTHFSNPYNQLVYSTPNYTITANTQNNPWLLGYGCGLEMSVWNIPFRIERAWGKIGDDWQSPQWLISLGKLF